jgi:hypothetical protein
VAVVEHQVHQDQTMVLLAEAVVVVMPTLQLLVVLVLLVKVMLVVLELITLVHLAVVAVVVVVLGQQALLETIQVQVEMVEQVLLHPLQEQALHMLAVEAGIV